MFKFSDNFFEDEVREGFYISAKMKHFWAAQIGVLEQIDRICKAHNLRFFAAYGTLLGAIRHRGFIPWDDDLDICMMRDELVAFTRFAREELPKEYVILDISSVGDYDNPLVRIVNSAGINYAPTFLKENYGCPFCVGVDIFPIDNVAPTEELRSKQRELLQLVAGARSAISGGAILDNITVNALSMIAGICGLEAKYKIDKIYLNRLSDALMQLYNNQYTEEVSVMGNMIKYPNHRFPRRAFEKSIIVSFEGYSLPVPSWYDRVLAINYGENYHVPQKGLAAHDYPIYKIQNNIIRETRGFGWCEHSKEEYSALIKNREEKLRPIDKADELAILLMEASSVIAQNSQTNDDYRSLLTTCQECAIQIGENIEKALFNDEGAYIVSKLEEYCEKIYSFAMDETRIDLTLEFIELASQIKELTSKNRNNHKNIVYLLSRATWCKQVLDLIKDDINKEDTDVHIYAIPYYRKNFDGSIAKAYYEKDEIEEIIGLPVNNIATTNDIYDLYNMVPDRIVTQDIYEDTNPTYTIENHLYSSVLLNYSKEVVCVPPVSPADYSLNDEIAMVAHRESVLSPGILLADRICVPSLAQKSAYKKILADYWKNDDLSEFDNRIEIVSAIEQKISIEEKTKRIMLFHMGQAQFEQDMQKANEKFVKILSILEKNKDIAQYIWIDDEVNPDSESEISVRREMFEKLGIGSYIKLRNASQNEYLEYINMADGYYGDPGYLMNLVHSNHKPVMKMELDI